VYLLIPHDAVNDAKTIQGMAAGFTLKHPKSEAVSEGA
jgi:hypothetical protein